MNATERAELTAELSRVGAEMEALRSEAIRLNAAVLASAEGSIESAVLCAHAEGVKAARQRAFDMWNSIRNDLRAEQDL